MRKTMLIAICMCCLLSGVFFSASALANDCGGRWLTLQGYRGGSGGPCAALGLNARVGTCRPGDTHETLCDDRSGGQYKICKGPRRCGAQTSSNCHNWDFNYGQPCPAGFYNYDCQGGCERK